MAQPASSLKASDLGLHEEEPPIDVLDLPQLYQRPTAKTLLSTLDDLGSAPPSWEATPRSGTPRTPRSGVSTPFRRRRKIKSEGVPRYLTAIIANPLAWIDDEDQKERIWEVASQRLSERSGRTAMGAISRTFTVPLRPDATMEPNGTLSPTEDTPTNDSDDVIDITLHEPALTADNLGLKTWAASYLLAKRICLLRPTLPELAFAAGPILELGAGTGLVGLAAAAVLNARVILTDLPAILPNLESNIRANAAAIGAHSGSAKAAVLDWSNPASFDPRPAPDPPSPSAIHHHPQQQHQFDLILAADPVYSTEHPRLFASAVQQHLRRSRAARLVIEVPLREAYGGERSDLHTRLADLGLTLVSQGEEVGFDDWGAVDDDDGLAEVRCWWGVWAWRAVGGEE